MNRNTVKLVGTCGSEAKCVGVDNLFLKFRISDKSQTGLLEENTMMVISFTLREC